MSNLITSGGCRRKMGRRDRRPPPRPLRVCKQDVQPARGEAYSIVKVPGHVPLTRVNISAIFWEFWSKKGQILANSCTETQI